MPCPCRAHAVSLPCRAAKGLDSVFPIWLTQCGRVWLTHAIPCPCRARAIPRPCRSESDFSRPRHSAAWTRHVWISTGRPETACWRPARVRPSSGYHAQFHEGCYQKHTNMLNCRSSSSDISGYHADSHEGHGTVGEWHGRGMACVN
jgi:hypothetical protein